MELVKAILLPLTLLLYGTNFIVALAMKFGKQRQTSEKIAICFGVNMSLILIGLIVIVVMRLAEVGFLPAF